MSRSVRIVSTATSVHRKGTVMAADLARRWHIGLESAQRTIERTTQLGVRDFSYDYSRQRARIDPKEFPR